MYKYETYVSKKIMQEKIYKICIWEKNESNKIKK